MNEMNAVRSVITLFLMILLAVSIAGWIWAGGQPPAKLIGARFVLAICGLSAVGSTFLLWRAKHPSMSWPAVLGSKLLNYKE